MWKTRSGRSLIEVLRSLGARINRQDVRAVEAAKEQDPAATTGDIVVRLELATPELVATAYDIAKKEGSPDILSLRFAEAAACMRETAVASAALSAVALAIAHRQPT